MNLASLSIKRPAFITCIVVIMIALGLFSIKRLGVDLFPNISFPIVLVTTPYPGAGPSEIETQVSKVLEDEISTLSGLKSLRTINKEGVSLLVAEFALETDIKYAEQQIRDRVSSAKPKLPQEIKEPMIRRVDPGDQPIAVLSFSADLSPADLYDFANEDIRPRLEQIPQVGLIEVTGGRKREIQVQLDRRLLNQKEISASQVAARIGAAGQNVPIGKVTLNKSETILRTLGEFRSLEQIENTIVNLLGNDVPVKIGNLGKVIDTLEDEKTRVYLNGKKSIFLFIYRQSGANTIAVVDGVRNQIDKINLELKKQGKNHQISVVRDLSNNIRTNVEDVEDTIFIGIILTVLVVFFFLGNARSTLITGLALPNSLLGAFVLMAAFGFTINVMTLLALSLAVGLLVDDAIVVRENIFRHIEMGEDPKEAALKGTNEVTLAVVATTLTVIAVFGPIAFVKGVVGQFFREFGLTICFAMLISLFDALTIAPMLSAYFAGKSHAKAPTNPFSKSVNWMLKKFDNFQVSLENAYERFLRVTVKRPMMTLVGAFLVFALSLFAAAKVKKTFLPAQDTGEFSVGIELPPGTNLEEATTVSKQIDEVIRNNKEVKISVMTVGSKDGESNLTEYFVELVARKNRKVNTSEFKDILREQLKPFAFAAPMVKDVDAVAGGMRPFSLNIIGNDLVEINAYAQKLFTRLKTHPGLKDPDISYKPGKPEFQVQVDEKRAENLGISSVALGRELRTLIEGATPAVFRQNGREYDIRIRLRDDQRNLREQFGNTFVPNINGSMIRLSDVAKGVTTQGIATIDRQDRGRYVQISADIAPNGPGLNAVITDIETWIATDLKIPSDLRYRFIGQAENFKELMESMVTAMGLGVFFIYLVLVSLYESFVTPLTIMLVLPLALCGAFYSLFLTNTSLDIFSMIGCIMLLGIATKNSILLVDYVKQLEERGVDQVTAIVEGCKTRLRPILMTSFALIAGMLPVAIGLNEASKQRTSMGIAIIGGLISSTFLSLLVVPAAYAYIERFRVWSKRQFGKLSASKSK